MSLDVPPRRPSKRRAAFSSSSSFTHTNLLDAPTRVSQEKITSIKSTQIHRQEDGSEQRVSSAKVQDPSSPGLKHVFVGEHPSRVRNARRDAICDGYNGDVDDDNPEVHVDEKVMANG